MIRRKEEKNSYLIRPLEYWWMDHPLTGEYTVIGDDYQSKKILNEVYQSYRFAPLRFQREVVLPYPVNTGWVKRRVKKYEVGLWKKWHQIADQRRFQEFTRLGFALCLSYLIWNSPGLYKGIDWIFGVLGDYLKLSAKIIITLGPVAFSLYHRILNLSKLEKQLRPLNFYPHLDDSLQAYFYKNLKELETKILRQMGRSHPVSDLLSSLRQTLRQKEISRDWEEYSRRIGELITGLPPNLARDVTSMLDDLCYYQKYDFAFAPLVIISPGNELSQKWAGFLTKTQKLREEFRREFRHLKNASSSQERILLVRDLENISLTLFRQASEDQLEIVRGLYDFLKVSLGKLGFRLKRKRLIFRNIRGKRLIQQWEKEINRYLNTGAEEIKTSSRMESSLYIRKSIFQEWGTWVAGIVMAFFLLAVVMGFTGLYWLAPEEFGIINHYRFGYRGLVGQQVEVVEYTRSSLFYFPFIGKKLFWTLPQPLAFFHRVSTQAQEQKFFFPLQEEEPDTRWKKILHSLKAEWGRALVGIEIIIKYDIQNKWQWAQLDYDGLGKIRLKHELLRKLSEHVDYNRSLFRDEIYAEISKDWQEYFQKLNQEGQLEKMIKNAVHYSYLLGSTKYALQLLEDEPTITSNPTLRQELEDEIKKVSLKMKNYFEEINLQPELLKALLKNPDTELLKYPELFRSVFYLVSETMITRRTLQMVKESLEKEKEDPLTRGFFDYLHKESRLEELAGIKILELQRKARDISAQVYYTETQKESNIY